MSENASGVVEALAGAGASCRLDELFARQAAETPAAPALLFRGKQTSYRELERSANRLAHHLRDRGVGPGSVVGVCLERSPDLIVSLLAVLKAGAAYLPLDPLYPTDRLTFMLEDSAARLLIGRAELAGTLGYADAVLDPEAERRAIAAQPATAPETGAGPDDLAYVIYTSGSTGAPKGVMLAHTVVRMIEWARETFTPAELSRVAATSSVCFDPSLFELFAPLCTGGMVILKDNAMEPFSETERPTMLTGVPSVFRELARAKVIPDSVRVINVGGERLKLELVHELYESCPVERVYNHYGPTEASTCASVAFIHPEAWEEPTIGRPIGGARMYVLDEEGRQVPTGEPGELYIAGPTVARGYLNRPELTAERFLADPFQPGERMYRTGDMARALDSGEFEFLGRIGEQVKLRGFRIELGEVESAMLRLPHVREAAALVSADGRGRDQLVAYVVADEPLELRDLRLALREWLPDHMLPSAMVQLDALPLTLNGKVDRNALPAPEPETGRTAPQQPVGSPTEQIIAEAFRQALNLGFVGPDDNFFELGGDSLLSIQLTLDLEARLNLSISPAELGQSPTPRQLAAMLEPASVPGADHLIVLQPSGQGAPVFCLPNIFGRSIDYVSLARRLPDNPMYGFSLGALSETIIEKPSVPELTRAFLADIRKVQPAGPYIVSGYSFGGVTAYDLACTLEEEGEEVLLILLDCPVFRRLPTLRHLVHWMRREWRAAVRRDGIKGALLGMYESRDTWLRNPRRVSLRHVPNWVPVAKRPLARAMMQARADYDYRPFGGSAVVVQCRRQMSTVAILNSDGMLGWKDMLTGPVLFIPADMGHYELMREPNVGALAKTFATLISDQVQVALPRALAQLD